VIVSNKRVSQRTGIPEDSRSAAAAGTNGGGMQLHRPKYPADGFAGRFNHDLHQLAGIEAYRLVRWPTEAPCTRRRAASPVGQALLCDASDCTRRLEQEQAECLVAFPRGWRGFRTTLCSRLSLAGGETLAVQLGLPPDAPQLGPHGLNMLSSLMLLWAREGLAREAAERQLAQAAELRQADLLKALKINDEEREWVAYEVHDRVAQTLASAFQQSQALETLTRDSPQAHRVAVRNSKLLKEALRESRNIMNDLHPPILDELGLVALMEEELRDLQGDTGCRVTTRFPQGLQLSHALELVIYRIFHEALVNVRRHSRATRVAVSLLGGIRSVRLRVRDNGVGFDVAAALASRRVGGLLSLRHRAELFGGRCSLDSTPGKGTTVAAWVPLRRLPEEAMPWRRMPES